jgi:arsenical pump membrane protein
VNAAAAAAGQTWPPFALVAGLLLTGAVADRDGVFDVAAAWLARTRGGFMALFAVSMAAVAATTVVLNLDTSVAFLTPVLVRLARHRGQPVMPFLYGCVYMSNAASLLLPGSNLTNLLVFAGSSVPGVQFARDMAPGWIAAVVVTAVLTPLLFRSHADRPRDVRSSPPAPAKASPAGWLAAAAVIVLILVLPQPALPVLAVGVLATAAHIVQRRVTLAGAVRRVNPPVLAALFILAIVLGTAARLWGGPAHLLASLGRWQTSGLAAVLSVLLNNLPAAVLLSSDPVPHARSLLLGLDIGPNLAVTGSLSAIIWLQAARSAGARPSARRYTLGGLVLVPCSIAAALLVFTAVDPAQL